MSKKSLILLFAAAAVVIATLSMLAVQSADALPQNEVEITYLDGAGGVVGSWFRGCDGQRFSDGQVTENKIVYTESCTSPSKDLFCWQVTHVPCTSPLTFYACEMLHGTNLCENN